MEKKKHNILFIIKACREKNQAAQKKLYQLYFSYGMSVALRYSSTRHEAEEIFNDAFFKVFDKIDRYDEAQDFKQWFRRIIINTSIDYFRKNKKLKMFTSDELIPTDVEQNEGWDNLVYEDVLKYIQRLPPSYRVVFNMYVIEGYKHREIAEQLDISIGTSKSNYAKARQLLQNDLKKRDKVNLYNYGK